MAFGVSENTKIDRLAVKMDAMQNFFILLGFSIMLQSCCTSRKEAGLALNQGIRGYVRELKGNQMPGPGRQPDTPRPISATVYIFSVATTAQVKAEQGSPFYTEINTELISSVVSDTAGFFAAHLPPGRYSLFTKVDGKYFANTFNEKNEIAMVEVVSGKMTDADILVNAKAVY